MTIAQLQAAEKKAYKNLELCTHTPSDLSAFNHWVKAIKKLKKAANHVK